MRTVADARDLGNKTQATSRKVNIRAVDIDKCLNTPTNNEFGARARGILTSTLGNDVSMIKLDDCFSLINSVAPLSYSTGRSFLLLRWMSGYFVRVRMDGCGGRSCFSLLRSILSDVVDQERKRHFHFNQFRVVTDRDFDNGRFWASKI